MLVNHNDVHEIFLFYFFTCQAYVLVSCNLLHEIYNGTIIIIRKLAESRSCTFQSPDLYVLFSRFRVIAVLLLFYLGLLPFCSLHESFFEVVMPNIILRWVHLRSGNAYTANNRRIHYLFFHVVPQSSVILLRN